MTCIIVLIDPTKERIIKECRFDGTYLESEKEAKNLNEKLNKKPNKKELYWKVTTINV